MDILKRELAPISKSAWKEIDARAEDVLFSVLSARRVVNVNGPKGWDYTVLSEGRLDVSEQKDKAVKTGVYRVKPLVEARVEFELNKWELDDITRGAKDIALDALEDGVKKLALFEEDAVYNGFKDGDIQGLKAVAETTLSFGDTGGKVLEALSQAILTLNQAYVKKPYTLIVGKKAYKQLNTLHDGCLLADVVKTLIGGDIVYSEVLEGALLVPYNHEDLELTIGQDFSIGYEHHTDQTITFFITESFTFRVLDPALIVAFE
ncbi:family 1 encapsulin nanocompartment shell protein [Fusibacter sp. JL298sf-3]